MSDFRLAMASRMISGLQRKSITRPSKWATTYRIMGEPYPGKWTFLHHPWLREMHDSEAEINVGQKSAQAGFTENVMNLTFYNMDVKRVDCLYVLPSKVPDATDFSSGRFDRALELSPHLGEIYSDVHNVGHKMAGTANMYIRGSRSRSQLKSVPVGFIVIDELDEMDQENIPLALERVSGQVDWAAWLISTPTYPDVGINKYFNDSTQEHFMFRCPSCSKLTELVYPDCLEIIGESQRDPRIEESHLKCKECKAKLHHELKTEWEADGIWVPTYTQRPKRGFHINQMYSMTNACRPAIMAGAHFMAQRSPEDETELYNSKLGLPHAVAGSQLTESDLIAHYGEYGNGNIRPRSLVTMGVDVGRYLHCVIREWQLDRQTGTDFNTFAMCRVIKIVKELNWDILDTLMSEWGVHFCVIDRNPEPRNALQFANKWYGHVRLCQYGQGINGKEISASKTEEHLVLVDRTSWFDLTLNRFRRKDAIQIPYDSPMEYKDHLKVLARIYKKDKDGNPVGYYENFGRDDHYAHAENYAEIASQIRGDVQATRKHYNPGGIMTGTEIKLPRMMHPAYNECMEDWTLWRDVYKSGWHFVNKYLEQFSLRETSPQFTKRKKLTPAPAFAKSAVMEVVNNIFQRMPDIVRTDGTKSYMDCLDGLNGGVDFTGKSMNYFIGMDILPELLVMRKVGVYVDMPNADGATLLDVRTRNIRPYTYRYKAEEILNWQYDYSDSLNEFQSLLLREDYITYDPKWKMPNGTAQRFRFMFIGEDGFVHAMYLNENEVPIDEYGIEGDSEVVLSIKKIPFVLFQIPHSLLEDAARYQVALLNLNSADIAYCMYSNFPFYIEQHDDRASSAWASRGAGAGGMTGAGTANGASDGVDREVQVGTAVGRLYPMDTDPPSFIAPPTEPLLASMKKQESFELTIRKLVNLAVIQLGQVQASAESKTMDNAGLEAGLSAIGIECERGERKIGEFWSDYENAQPPTVHYPLRYSLKSDTERREEATDLTKIAPEYPSQTMRKEVLKLSARTLMSSKISKPKMQAIETEIDACEIVATNSETILKQVEAGVLDKKNAAKALILPKDAVDIANKEHAERLAVIAEHQMKNLPGARGNPDAAGASGQGSTEKQAPGAAKGGEPPVTRGTA